MRVRVSTGLIEKDSYAVLENQKACDSTTDPALSVFSPANKLLWFLLGFCFTIPGIILAYMRPGEDARAQRVRMATLGTIALTFYLFVLALVVALSDMNIVASSRMSTF